MQLFPAIHAGVIRVACKRRQAPVAGGIAMRAAPVVTVTSFAPRTQATLRSAPPARCARAGDALLSLAPSSTSPPAHVDAASGLGIRVLGFRV